MFTSRAEYRLQLREDNADLRLTETGRELGLVGDARWAAFERKRERLERELQRLRSTWCARPRCRRWTPNGCSARPSSANTAWPTCCGVRASASMPPPSWRRSRRIRRLFHVNLRAEFGRAEADAVIEQAEIAIKYAGYIDKQNDEVDRASALESLVLPEDLDYARSVPCPSRSARRWPATAQRRWGRRRASRA